MNMEEDIERRLARSSKEHDSSISVRQYLGRRVARAMTVGLVAAAILFSAKFLGPKVPAALVVSCVLAFVASSLLINFGVRCIVCGANLASLFVVAVGFGKRRKAEVCPYCSSSLDLSVAEAQQTAARDRVKKRGA